MAKRQKKDEPEPAMERCAGCGILARTAQGGHPMVGVLNVEDAELLGYSVEGASDRGFIDVPICGSCHQDPAHRMFQLKCHFFPRSHALTAKRAAGSNSIG